MKITVIISTWVVPYDQTVKAIKTFKSAQAAKEYVNTQARQWWEENEGDRSLKECGGDPYEPVEELGYNHARYEIWQGEMGFHAMLDAESYAQLHEEHYKREYDDKGITRPGYLINSYVAGQKPGGMTEAERESYEVDQEIGLEALEELRK